MCRWGTGQKKSRWPITIQTLKACLPSLAVTHKTPSEKNKRRNWRRWLRSPSTQRKLRPQFKHLAWRRARTRNRCLPRSRTTQRWTTTSQMRPRKTWSSNLQAYPTITNTIRQTQKSWRTKSTRCVCETSTMTWVITRWSSRLTRLSAPQTGSPSSLST